MMSVQNQKLLDAMRQGHSINRQSAMLLGVQNLTARISELRADSKVRDIVTHWPYCIESYTRKNVMGSKVTYYRLGSCQGCKKRLAGPDWRRDA